MARLPTCPHCLKEVENKEPSKKNKGKTYHLKCYQDEINKKFNNTKESDTNEKQELYNYIKEKYSLEEVTPMIDKQISNYCLTYSLDYSDIQKILIYFYDLCENNVTTDGIGIIPYIIHEATEFYKMLDKTNEINQKVLQQSLKNKMRVVSYKRKEDKKKAEIDIDNL